MLKASGSEEPLWAGFWPWLCSTRTIPRWKSTPHAPGSQGRKFPFEDLEFLTLVDPITNPQPQAAEDTAGVTLRQNSSWHKGEIPTGAVIPWGLQCCKGGSELSTGLLQQNSLSPDEAGGVPCTASTFLSDHPGIPAGSSQAAPSLFQQIS